MTHPGVGPLTALAFELVIGTPRRFQCGEQEASYVGLVPTEESSGDRRRLGHISKQGNALLRFLLIEAAQVTVRSQFECRSRFFHLVTRRGRVTHGQTSNGFRGLRFTALRTPQTAILTAGQTVIDGLVPNVRLYDR